MDGFLHAGFVQVVAALCAAARVGGEAVGGKDVLPEPVAVGVGVFTLQGMGQVNGAKPLFQVAGMPLMGALDLFLEGGDGALGQDGDAVFVTFAIAHDDEILGKVYILHAQAEAFHEA